MGVLGRYGVVLAAALACLLPGCGVETAVSMRSGAGSALLTPGAITAVYRPIDKTTADLYLTDMTRRELDGSIDPGRVSGSIIHIYLFITPSPGQTPVDSTACSAVVRYAVLARGEVGVYGGGGFLRPRSKLGSASIPATLSNASMRLVESTEGFQDLLGPASLNASFTSQRNEGLARLIAARLEEAMGRATPVPDATP